MCGRFAITVDDAEYFQYCGALAAKTRHAKLTVQDPPPPLRLGPRYNISPASHVGAVLVEEGVLKHLICHWWILPSYAVSGVEFKLSAAGGKTFRWKAERRSHFNSRFDTITNPKNRYWHGLLDKRRCVIAASGFVEWPAEEMLAKGEKKIPHYFRLKSGGMFCFAGLWEKAVDDESQPFYSVNIITVEPNDLLARLPHHRMPAILAERDVEAWLEPANRADQVQALLRPTPAELMEGYAIGDYVNSSRNDSPECLAPRERQG